eukprot:TRINITY_DN1469_c0_g1_i2.p1 TRINITY_DN1469_c0_g1~~TRINITY_DN1469_c0_g1_i2.p1  ORF type:complete len:210 (+),score=24.03 TRINITY_DN1469_c0_g1_i2:377-1006(+)
MNIYQIYDNILDFSFSSTETVFNTSAFIMSNAVWFEVVSSSKKLKMSRKLKTPMLMTIGISIFSVIFFLILITIGIIADTWELVFIIEYIFLGVLYIFMMIVMCYYLPKMTNLINELDDRSSGKSKLKKVNNIMMWYLGIYIFSWISYICLFLMSLLMDHKKISYAIVVLIQQLSVRLFSGSGSYVLTYLLLFGWISEMRDPSVSSTIK